MMFTRILVDFDLVHLSRPSLVALLDLAQANHAALTFLAVRPQLDELLSESEESFLADVHKQIGTEWATLLSAARERELQPRLHILAGDSIECLLAFGREMDADLIVAGKSHCGGLKNAILGVPCKELLGRAEVAILILP